MVSNVFKVFLPHLYKSYLYAEVEYSNNEDEYKKEFIIKSNS